MENVTEISYLVNNICLGLAGAAAAGSLIIAYYFKPVKKERKELALEGELENKLIQYVKED